ncbi:hypothetical protein BC936DRAFT_139589 [Jimgerdemannia flammicorona]|uniref:Uncharacterized protein n=1 Tax=Jimgerdemannia flammicorona TaxID=994334 RepID=A0A433DHQ0_9FUNG|nr:hypothetical protein BC936DRAFT_139589 [Jimgerdemannia flammicorona]
MRWNLVRALLFRRWVLGRKEMEKDGWMHYVMWSTERGLCGVDYNKVYRKNVRFVRLISSFRKTIPHSIT